MMRYKRRFLMLAIPVLILSAAAFLAGRLFNGGLTANAAPVSVNMIPAIELPAVHSDVTGAFAERQDHTIIVTTRSHGQSGPQVEILVTGETMIYRETTQHDEPLSAGVQNIQQTVEEGDLDELSPEFTLSVWGRRSGE